MTLDKLQYRLGISIEQINKIVEENEAFFWLAHKQGKWILTHEQWEELQNRVLKFINEFHKKNPFQAGAQKEEIRQNLDCEENILDVLLQKMQDDKTIIQEGKVWHNPEFTVTLSNEEDALQSNLLSQLNEEGFTSSNLSQLSKKTGNSKDKLMRLLIIAEQQGKLLRINGSLMFTQTNFLKLQKKVAQHFTNHSEMSVSEFKELAETSRKYAVPLLEYFDKKKITYREGNSRKLVK